VFFDPHFKLSKNNGLFYFIYIMFFYVILFLIILSVLVYYLYNKFIKKDKKLFIPNDEFVDDNKTGELILFFTNWCPHCKSTIEKWNLYKEKYSLDYKISFRQVDCELNSNEASIYNIESYPTIILRVNDKKYEYDSDFSNKTMDKFINTIMSSQ
jgi:thiol-disulfide isomerase/thioredoxin